MTFGTMGNTFRGYIKLRNQLSGSLDDVRNQLRDKIKAAYNDIFDYLLQVAEKQNVPASVLSDREATIQLKTAPTNILVLRNNILTDVFYREQVNKIMSYIPPKPTKRIMMKLILQHLLYEKREFVGHHCKQGQSYLLQTKKT